MPDSLTSGIIAALQGAWHPDFVNALILIGLSLSLLARFRPEGLGIVKNSVIFGLICLVLSLAGAVCGFLGLRMATRVLDEMSVEETAELLGVRPETVKTRLFRARRLLREALAEHVDPAMSDVFPFAGRRCERLAEAVVARLKETS